jgi:hypothetical protein
MFFNTALILSIPYLSGFSSPCMPYQFNTFSGFHVLYALHARVGPLARGCKIAFSIFKGDLCATKRFVFIVTTSIFLYLPTSNRIYPMFCALAFSLVDSYWPASYLSMYVRAGQAFSSQNSVPRMVDFVFSRSSRILLRCCSWYWYSACSSSSISVLLIRSIIFLMMFP